MESSPINVHTALVKQLNKYQFLRPVKLPGCLLLNKTNSKGADCSEWLVEIDGLMAADTPNITSLIRVFQQARLYLK